MTRLTWEEFEKYGNMSVKGKTWTLKVDGVDIRMTSKGIFSVYKDGKEVVNIGNGTLKKSIEAKKIEMLEVLEKEKNEYAEKRRNWLESNGLKIGDEVEVVEPQNTTPIPNERAFFKTDGNGNYFRVQLCGSTFPESGYFQQTHSYTEPAKKEEILAMGLSLPHIKISIKTIKDI